MASPLDYIIGVVEGDPAGGVGERDRAAQLPSPKTAYFVWGVCV
jgi:hypothetical protein